MDSEPFTKDVSISPPDVGLTMNSAVSTQPNQPIRVRLWISTKRGKSARSNPDRSALLGQRAVKASFRQRDITRAIRGVESAGLIARRVEITLQGNIIVETEGAAAKVVSVEAEFFERRARARATR